MNPDRITWIVQRVESNGETTRTNEFETEDAASALYDNWCNNAKKFNDQLITLIRVTHTETVVSNRTNTKFTEPLLNPVPLQD